MSHDVFISHSARDGATAEAVCGALESAGIRCWMASRDIVGGNYADAIMKAIKASRVMVLVLTPDADDSPHVLREVERAVTNRVTIYPLVVKKTELSAALEYFISSEQSLDATTPPLEKHLTRLSQNVVRMLQQSGGRPTPRPPSAEEQAPAPAPRRDYLYDAYVCASVIDRAWAKSLYAHLKVKGFKCHLDTSHLLAGLERDPSEMEFISKARHLVVLWSNRARKSEWVRRELGKFEVLIDPLGTGQAAGDRRIIFVVLEGEATAYQHFQRINDVKETGAYARGFEQIDHGVWTEVVNKVAEALSQ